MRNFRDLSIRYKLTLLLMGVVSVVLLAVSITSVVVEVRTTRSTLAAKFSTLAKIVAAQSGAALSIADVDASGAQQIVTDLDATPLIRFAALFNADGAEVAHYQADAAEERPTSAPALGTAFVGNGYLDVVEEVTTNDGEIVGRLYLRATTQELQRQVQRTVLIAIVVYVVALAFALLLSIVLQRLITTPILQLARLTDRVTTEHDYSLTAFRRGNDELGALCDRFNSMLAEIRRRDDELNQSNDELLRSNEELRQFAFIASHDLQEPLRSITSFCNLLKDGYHGKLDQDADDFIDRIVGGAKRMKALVTDLLAYSRVQRDEQPVFRPVEFNDVVNDVLENMQSSIDETGAVIVAEPMPTVLGDRVQLVQLVQNLVGNAMKYRGEQPPRIEIDVQRRGDFWEFFVSDNGIGIAPEHHQQIFQIFKRLHGRDKYPGTGIGLAVCKKIVQRHGGQISVDSRLGAGSVFRFTIQARLEESPHEHQECLATSV